MDGVWYVPYGGRYRHLFIKTGRPGAIEVDTLTACGKKGMVPRRHEPNTPASKGNCPKCVELSVVTDTPTEQG